MTDQKATSGLRKFLKYFGVIAASIFLAATILHRLTLGSSGYTKSPLIGVEFILMLALVFMTLACFMWTIMSLISREWASFKGALINLIACAAGLSIGVWIDAPTLIYMT